MSVPLPIASTLSLYLGSFPERCVSTKQVPVYAGFISVTSARTFDHASSAPITRLEMHVEPFEKATSCLPLPTALTCANWNGSRSEWQGRVDIDQLKAQTLALLIGEAEQRQTLRSQPLNHICELSND